jgi:hypothetical protein
VNKYLSIKNYLFITALLLYAIISNPFPKNISISEILIGFLFVLSIDYTYLLPLNPKASHLRFDYLISLQTVFFILLFVPTLTIIYSSKFTLEDYIRDVVSLLYMFIPYFYNNLISSKFKWYLYLPWVISIMGTILSFKYLYAIYSTHGITPFLNIGSASYRDDLLYLTYDSSVHFSSVFFLSSSILMASKQKYFFSVLTFSFGMISFLGNLLVAQRAPTFLTIFSVIIFSVITFARRKKRYFTAVALVGIIFLLIVSIQSNDTFYSLFNLEKIPIFSKLLEKQEKFGLNAKDSEFYTVLNIVFSSAPKLIFGIGWGSVFKDPIIPEVEVSFTHSALTYFLLKTGLLGFACFITYIFIIFKSFFNNKNLSNDSNREFFTHKTLVFLSASPAIIIGIFLQVSYKTLSFGVVLLSLFLFC